MPKPHNSPAPPLERSFQLRDVAAATSAHPKTVACLGSQRRLPKLLRIGSLIRWNQHGIAAFLKALEQGGQTW